MANTLNRRSLVKAAVAGGSALLLPKAFSIQVTHTGSGCLLPYGSVSEGGNFAVLSERLITSTGDKQMDRALGRALIRIAQVFGERPGFGFIDDSNGKNAYATPESQVPGTWGTVLYGQNMFADLMARNNDQGMAVLAVAAHEFGHIAQYHADVEGRLLEGQNTVKRVELHADLLSGYFLGLRKQQDPSISVWAAGKTFFEIGDFQFNNRDHHGTPDERVKAAEQGFRIGSQRLSFQRAFNDGLEYVLSNF